jgi:hypothetical protein
VEESLDSLTVRRLIESRLSELFVKLLHNLADGATDTPPIINLFKTDRWGKSSVEEWRGVSAERGIPTFGGVGKQTPHAGSVRRFARLPSMIG